MRAAAARLFNWSHLVPLLTVLATLSLMLAAFSVAQFVQTRESTSRGLCQTVENRRVVVLGLVELVAANSDSARLNLTGLPEFNELDPLTQDYLRSLEIVANVDNPDDLSSSLRQFAKDKLAPQACK